MSTSTSMPPLVTSDPTSAVAGPGAGVHKPSSTPPTQAPTSPSRPKHLTTRSITEISPPSHPKARSRSHHHHHHPHIHKHRPAESQTALGLAGLQIVTSDPHVGKFEGIPPPAESRNVSRRGSLYSGSAEMVAILPGTAGGKMGERNVKEGEVKEEKERGVLRATELRNALLELNALSNNTTRRLDNTYYSVLEKLSILQSTITSMKELASITRQLNHEFTGESEGVVADVTSQLDSFEGFNDQEKHISRLAERVQKGRERIKALGGRVDLVKSRVEGWEAAEAEWKDKTRRRLKMMWIVMAIIGGIFVINLVFQYSPAKSTLTETSEALNGSGLLGNMPDLDLDTMKNDTRVMQRHSRQVLEGLRNNERREEDPRLRAFDEL